ncbi:MAG TPA: leucyl aminopeptidase [Methylocella sp.]|nr:leucyl aminopeptidase [Methylocella sp.]
MEGAVKIEIIGLGAIPALTAAPAEKEEFGTFVIFAEEELALGKATTRLLGGEGVALIKKAAAAVQFKGKSLTTLDLIAPARLNAERLIVIGTGASKNDAPAEKNGPAKPEDYASLGGFAGGKLSRAGRATIVFDFPEAPIDAARAVADFVAGLRLRAYRFDLYKTKKKNDDEVSSANIRLAVEDPAAVRRAVKQEEAVIGGVLTARSLVNEPANILYPEEFAKRAVALKSHGIEVTVLTNTDMRELGMGAMLGVAQGASRESRIVCMRWRGKHKKDGAAKEKPLAFVGKGVCFDSGGISIKPAAGMEDMKGDMAGAACVMGLLQALAERKAKVDAIGVIGLVENMPGPNAQRPGDIVKSMSGQTIEIINTDAEGRLVLADLLWYVKEKFNPAFIIDLATLTGAILVALGHEHAGLFSNNDELANRLLAAGTATGEKLWRMPLGPAYDKLIDSKFADMKNVGGRHAGSITAAQFLQRFIKDTPWAHLDIAGTGMNSPSTEINQSWGSGFGVRLLDRLIADSYEK